MAYVNQQGGDEVLGPHAGGKECVSGGVGPEHDSVSQIRGGGGHSVQGEPGVKERMVPESDIFPADLSSHKSAVGGFVRHTPEQVTHLHIPVQGRSDALSYPWRGMWGYAYPPTEIMARVLTKIR